MSGGYRDQVANAPVVIDHKHANGHAGRNFFASFTGSVANNGVHRMLFDVASGCFAHFEFEADSEALALLALKLVGSYTGATTLTVWNRNFVSTLTSSVLVSQGGSLNVDSGTILSHLLGAGNAGNSGGDTQDSMRELILRGPIVVALDLTNIAGATKNDVGDVWLV